MLGLYGVVVNTVKCDFSKLLGVYVVVFCNYQCFVRASIYRIQPG
jgi:hypothetical protein